MRYRREIDGLRALAVIPVILFHAGFQSWGGGFVGVDVFFVISGYLITSIILAEKQAGTFTLANFYERRARRILPALFLVLFACLPFAWLWLLPLDMKSFSQSLIAVAGFASNILFWRTSGYFETAAELKPLLHTWSLAIEEQYYLLFPLFLLATWRLGKRWVISILVIVSILSLCAAQWAALSKPAAAFFLLPTRAWELSIGAFVAFYLPHRGNDKSHTFHQLYSLIGVLLIVYSVFQFDKQTPFPSLYALLPTIGTALIILFTSPQTLVGQLLGSKPMVGIGLISYSAYLWHQPLLAFARHTTVDAPSKGVLSALVMATLMLAYLSWKFVETPFRNRRRFSRTQILCFSALASIIVISIGLVGHLTNGYVFRTYDHAIQHIEKARNETGKNSACWNLIANSQSLSSACELGKTGSEKSFALVGDSHAGALVEALHAASLTAQLSGFDFTYNSCLPLSGGMAAKQDSTQATCNAIREEFFKQLAANKNPKTLILLARWTIWIEQERFNNHEHGIESGTRAVWNAPHIDRMGYIEALKKSYADSINLMLAAGYKVILIYPIPEAGWDVPMRLGKLFAANQTLAPEDASTSYNVFVKRNAKAYEALDAIGEHSNLIRIKPEHIFCNTLIEGRCVTQQNNMPFYYDNNHLSNFGARLIVDEIIKHLDH
ncbi:MAG: acyltransferase [Betaproteobacteria bacterium]|nr:acyltransferase [Betaproteobacteria bacterium]